MSDIFSNLILKHIGDQRYRPINARQLAQELGIEGDQIDAFKKAVDQLVKSQQVVLGPANAMVLPPPGREMTGLFRLNRRGFGFLQPDSPTEHGDLFIPAGNTADALTGDMVRARVLKRSSRARSSDKSPYIGQIIEVLERANNNFTGTLARRGSLWVVHIDRHTLIDPVIVRDPGAKNANAGDKVVIEMLEYPTDDEPGQGVITEVLGEAGEPDVETLAVMRSHGLHDGFGENLLNEARAAAREFDDAAIEAALADGLREDWTTTHVLTIDPPDARDFDDAISITRFDSEGEDEAREAQTPRPYRHPDALWELVVHIADVSHFVKKNGALDTEAYTRGNSAYLPRKVVPMLPELLSNGVCSLQENEPRFCKSAMIQFDAKGKVLHARFARTVIRSAKRLTYLEAQALIDDDIREAHKQAKTEPKYPRELIRKLKQMDELSRIIRKRRLSAGMIVLDLPDVELVFDETGRVVDAVPEDDAFTHTLIEMFMVEANEAAARLFNNMDVHMIRRIHADPPVHDTRQLRRFVRVGGYNIPDKPSRMELQQLLDAVRDKPTSYAVHMAVLRTLSQAEYSPMLIGHFALASEHYTHYTSPIRRYPDLVVHRALDAYLDALSELGGAPAGKKKIPKAVVQKIRHRCPDEAALQELGRHCSGRERNAESAERDLRTYLVLDLLSQYVGADYAGTVTGVTGSGIFVRLDHYLVEGFVPMADLVATVGNGREHWRMNRDTGALVAQRSGRSITIGDQLLVRTVKVVPADRLLELVVIDDRPGKTKQKRRQPPGARKSHQSSMRLKQANDKKGDKGAKRQKGKKGKKGEKGKKGKGGSKRGGNRKRR